MFKKSPLKATRHRERRRINRLLIFCIAFVVIILVVVGVSWFSESPRFQIREVIVVGNAAVDADAVEAIVRAHISGSYFGLFSKSNKYVYPRQNIEESLSAAFSSIASLDLAVSGNTLTVSLHERTPKFVWCKGVPPVSRTHECYLMDESGYIFEKAPQFSGNVFFVFFGMIVDENPLNRSYLSPSELDGVEGLRSSLSRAGVNMVAFVALEKDIREIHLETSGKILFKTGQDIAMIQNSLLLIREKTELLSTTTPKKLEYIDLRFGSKVYYRFVGDNAVQASE